ncbi:MAG TPA: glycoside hydrolase family 2 TIM barrel-domain containing protein, partial [Chloroflexota bacterium]|nr:glycoside hydrolase family 2 TIM barrel-domain containing protein [Chloroflexota bacterium]
GYTSQMRDWKPRFNYFWDWTPRLVQIGVWDDLWLEISDGQAITAFDPQAHHDHATGDAGLAVRGALAGDTIVRVELSLERDGGRVAGRQVSAAEYATGLVWDGLPVEPWWPNGQGEQPLYRLRARAYDAWGYLVDEETRTIGFKSIDWRQCEGAPAGADPWICAINDRPTFLQGVNWTPILPNFADATDSQYRRLLETYRDLGCNVVRFWGGAFLEKRIFYDLCDRLGLLVWQELPLSSSGLDNRPPDDNASIEEMVAIAASYVERRRHHVSLLLWCGGNELQNGPPIDRSHPMIGRLEDGFRGLDPHHRFLPTSPSGPRFGADAAEFGKGIHWDVHGPWNARGPLEGEWSQYWENDDALFRSEVGAPGASPAELIEEYRGDLPAVPGTAANPLWRRTGWWIEWPEFVAELGREPHELAEYVDWSQERQARALAIAASACRRRFPGCGGIIVWMGHDCFPCTANTAIVDFQGRPKPAAGALRAVFRGPDRPPSGAP